MIFESQHKIANVQRKLYLSLLAVALHVAIEMLIIIQLVKLSPKLDFILGDYITLQKFVVICFVLCRIIGSLLGDLLRKNELFLLVGCCLEISGMVILHSEN